MAGFQLPDIRRDLDVGDNRDDSIGGKQGVGQGVMRRKSK